MASQSKNPGTTGVYDPMVDGDNLIVASYPVVVDSRCRNVQLLTSDKKHPLKDDSALEQARQLIEDAFADEDREMTPAGPPRAAGWRRILVNQVPPTASEQQPNKTVPPRSNVFSIGVKPGGVSVHAANRLAALIHRDLKKYNKVDIPVIVITTRRKDIPDYPSVHFLSTSAMRGFADYNPQYKK